MLHVAKTFRPLRHMKARCVETNILAGLFVALFMIPPTVPFRPVLLEHPRVAPRAGIDNKLYYWICLLPFVPQQRRQRTTSKRDGMEGDIWSGLIGPDPSVFSGRWSPSLGVDFSLPSPISMFPSSLIHFLPYPRRKRCQSDDHKCCLLSTH